MKTATPLPSMPKVAPLAPPKIGPVATPPRIPPVAGPPRLAPAAAPPPAATPAGVKPADLADLERLALSMDEMDYFELLHCDRGAAPAAIKAAFYKWSRTFHPDKFFQLNDKTLKERVNDVYKRITEAYYVLRDDAKRAKYLGDIAGPERAQKLRFTESSELETKAAKKKEVEEQVGTHPKGRQFFQTGMQDLAAERWSSAERNFKMALTYEPANPKYKEKYKEAADKVYEQTRGDQFKIK